MVSNDDGDKTFEVDEVNPVEVTEENVFIEADVVNKPNAVDAVRSEMIKEFQDHLNIKYEDYKVCGWIKCIQ